MLVNDFHKPEYGGPCPPQGHGPHHYRFTLYALDIHVIRVRGERRADFEEGLSSHILASATLTGLYERR
jgi:Raf kinase inhibitor-like YbhB/YbcL family protein